MPYCSLEEAWGGDFDSNSSQLNQELPFSNIDSNDREYMSINYEEHNQDNELKDKVYSRNMSRLVNHSGPMNRYTQPNKNNKLNYTSNVENKWYPKKELSLESPPSYLNLDLPINKYDHQLKNKILSKQIGNDEYNEIVEEQYILNNKNILNKGNLINNEENSVNSTIPEESLDDYSNYSSQEKDIQSSNYNSRRTSNNDNAIYNSIKNNDDMYDVVIYIATGIFIIFILDIFTKLGRNKR